LSGQCLQLLFGQKNLSKTSSIVATIALRLVATKNLVNYFLMALQILLGNYFLLSLIDACQRSAQAIHFSIFAILTNHLNLANKSSSIQEVKP
jgi:hypothetical protein